MSSGSGWKNINYKQDMAPPGGYGKIPFKRNLPIKGPPSWLLFGFAAGYIAYSFPCLMTISKLKRREKIESQLAANVYYPLLEAEKDRAQLKSFKEEMESEALNIIGTGFDPNHKVGGHLTNYNENKRWHHRRIVSTHHIPFAGIYYETPRMRYEKIGP